MLRHGRRGFQTLAVVVATALLAACSHHAQRVAREMVLPPSAQMHTVESNQHFLMAVPIADPDPAYPERAILDGVLRLCTTFAVTGDGEVADIEPDREDPACADPVDPATAPFAAAVDTALRRWRYFGAAICTFPEDRDAEADPRCEGPGVRIDPVPIRVRYVFTFSSERGGRVLRAQASSRR